LKEIASIKRFVSAEELEIVDVLKLLKRASDFKRGGRFLLNKRQYFATNMFFENSTRTHYSFHIAEKKLGIDVLEFNANNSSLQKGETLSDTVLTMSAIGVDVVIIRSNLVNYWQKLNSPLIKCRIINAGDGSGQHPSQCLLDLMTIQEEFGTFSDLKVAFVGDLAHSRVARSNLLMLTKLGATVYFSAPKVWFSSEFEQYGENIPLDELLSLVDVLMLLRVQHERHDGVQEFSKEEYHKNFGLTFERANRLQKHAIIMHPAPVNRNVEIAGSLVEADNSRIVEQMRNGVFARMAILEAVLSR